MAKKIIKRIAKLIEGEVDRGAMSLDQAKTAMKAQPEKSELDLDLEDFLDLVESERALDPVAVRNALVKGDKAAHKMVLELIDPKDAADTEGQEYMRLYRALQGKK